MAKTNPETPTGMDGVVSYVDYMADAPPERPYAEAISQQQIELLGVAFPEPEPK